MRVGTALVLCCVVALLGAAATAQAHALHVGLIDSTQLYDDIGAEQDLVAQTGTRWIREDLAWRDVQPERGQWDWSDYDDLFAAAAERHLHVLPILDAPPCWAVPSGTDSTKCWQTYPSD